MLALTKVDDRPQQAPGAPLELYVDRLVEACRAGPDADPERLLHLFLWHGLPRFFPHANRSQLRTLQITAELMFRDKWEAPADLRVAEDPPWRLRDAWWLWPAIWIVTGSGFIWAVGRGFEWW